MNKMNKINRSRLDDGSDENHFAFPGVDCYTDREELTLICEFDIFGWNNSYKNIKEFSKNQNDCVGLDIVEELNKIGYDWKAKGKLSEGGSEVTFKIFKIQ